VSNQSIKLRQVRVNNLNGIDLDIPHGQWLAICGVSGSGKSSLAFDTLYAEGQRRYLECLSPSARKFVTLLDKPDADAIEGMPPAIAVRPARGVSDRKSCVGNATEILEFLRLLYAKVSRPFCASCRKWVDREDPQSVAAWFSGLDKDRKALIAASMATGDQNVNETLASARALGFSRAIIGERTVATDTVLKPCPRQESVLVIVDRLLTGGPDTRQDSTRLTESLETAFQFGTRRCQILVESESVTGRESLGHTKTIDRRLFDSYSFSAATICSTCGHPFEEAQPRLFSFNSPRGACPACDGVGFQDDRFKVACHQCSGWRLQPKALDYRIPTGGASAKEGGQTDAGTIEGSSTTIAQVCRWPIPRLFDWLHSLELTPASRQTAQPLMDQIEQRVRFLMHVGLGYLTLDRPVRTLSLGESQRVSLTSCLSSTLVEMLYVLDEPSVGLHAEDVGRLTTAIRELNERGNTVVVVDHEESLITAAPQVLEVGPGAGAAGGDVVYCGATSGLVDVKNSPTGDFLAGRRGVSSGAGSRRKPRGKLRLTGASGHNLKDLHVEFPLGCLCLVTGVSGAGKSTLVRETLYPAICQKKGQKANEPLPLGDLFGDSLFDEVILVDQSPIGRSARSNPVTYVKAFDQIRAAFGETTDAKTRNIKPGQFSFNVAGGRCERCKGDGQLTVDMQFLSNVYVKCDQCQGTRYREDVLAVRYRDLNIAEVLNLTVREAFLFFRGQPKVQNKLKALIDVGLDYIRLGQPATTLSCGEAQRLKLAVYLNAFSSKRVLFILEEPTTGLHMADVVKLVDCFDALLAVGHSFIIVEHNLQLMKYADWIVDLGPGAGDAGGQLVAAGTPEQVANSSNSVTGHHLAAALEACQTD
jgi:excinuclease ABC subunit A